MGVALAEIDQGRSEEDATQSSRGLLLPRLVAQAAQRWFGAKEAVSQI